MPSVIHIAASTTCGIRIIQPTSSLPCFAACAATCSLVRERKLTPKNFINEASVRALVSMAMTAHTARYPAITLPCIADMYMHHLLTKPLNSGTPEIENDAMRAVIAVSGMNFIRPPILLRSWVPVAWSIEPALRNSRALNSPWLRTWSSAPKKPIAASAAFRFPPAAGHARSRAQQDVTDLADAVEGEQAFGLFLLERLHCAGKQRDGAQQRDDQAPFGERVIGLPGRRHQPEEITHQAVHAGLDHHAGKHGAHGRRRGWVRIRQPELAERPHAHLDAEPDEEQARRPARSRPAWCSASRADSRSRYQSRTSSSTAAGRRAGHGQQLGADHRRRAGDLHHDEKLVGGADVGRVLCARTGSAHSPAGSSSARR